MSYHPPCKAKYCNPASGIFPLLTPMARLTIRRARMCSNLASELFLFQLDRGFVSGQSTEATISLASFSLFQRQDARSSIPGQRNCNPAYGLFPLPTSDVTPEQIGHCHKLQTRSRAFPSSNTRVWYHNGHWSILLQSRERAFSSSNSTMPYGLTQHHYGCNSARGLFPLSTVL
jgi:hypothetical protein